MLSATKCITPWRGIPIEEAGPAPAGARVLLAEHDPLLLQAHGQALTKAGFVVDYAGSGEEAVGLLLANAYDSLVTDIGLPSGDGVSNLQAMHRSDPDVPVVLLAGARSADAAQAAVELAVSRLLIQPVSATQLQDAVVQSARTHRVLVLRRMAVELASAAWSPAEDRRSLREVFDRAMQSLWIAYQSVLSWKHQQSVACEALLRSSEPAMANPCVLLSAAERLGRMAELGRAVRDLVAADVPGAPGGLVFVNLHGNDLLDEHLYDPGAPLSRVADRVVLEISERTQVASIPGIETRMARLRNLGFRIGLDNLGAGALDLRALTVLQPEFVKYDMSLVRGIDSSPTRRKVVSAITTLLGQMDVKVIATGIESDLECSTLVLLGVDLMQGYWYARPAPLLPQGRDR
jgi:EAL domain-containing protein (putative c-di-GMP-specific phosphodiesterase class I)